MPDGWCSNDAGLPHLRWDAGGVTAIMTGACGADGGAFNLSLSAGPTGYVRRAREVVQSSFELRDAVRIVQQVHGTAISDEGTPWLDDDPNGVAPIQKADGIVTPRGGPPIAVLVADCAPVVLVGSDSLAVVHAGWRGLTGGVLEAAVDAMTETPTAAAIGPCIGPCCFEVGPEVSAHFAPGHVRDSGSGRPYVDLAAAAATRLRGAGVSNIDIADVCTACDDRWWSYRRDGQAAGRQALVAW